MLRAEGRVTFIDGILAAAVLAGLVLNAAVGWWWADPLAGYVLVVNRRLRDPRHLHRAPLILTLIAFVLPLGLDSFAVSAAVSAAGGVSGRAAVVGQGGPGCQLLVQLRGAADDHCVHSQRHGGKLVWMFATLLSARSSH